MKSKALPVTVGSPVRGSKTGRPVMVALDLLGRRSALRVLWELWELRGESLTFRALQAAADTNPGLLNTRLKELRAVGLIEHTVGGYRLTACGQDLLAVVQPLSEWASRWGAGLDNLRRQTIDLKASPQ